MGYNNVPVNGWPQIKDLEKLDALAKKIDNMPTYTSTDRAFLDEWEANLPILAQDVSDLETTKANQITIAPTFSAETAYSPGDLVYYNGLTYRCTNAHEGEWDADDFAATTINNELASLNSNLNGKAVVPSNSATKLDTVAGSDSQNFTVTDSGYLAIYCNTGSSQKAFSAIVRDNTLTKYGVYVNATIPAYNSEAIGGLYVKKGRTYSVRNIGENEIDVYLCV